jgi:transaldolase/glucose-6-phosphate isomerase
LFVVPSKSGSTLEPALFHEYFLERARRVLGDRVAARFVAVTDPGSQLDRRAAAEGFGRIFRGEPSIGGRYSVLSPFGLVPAALLGLDLETFLDRAAAMAEACGPEVEAAHSPGAALGLLLGVAARAGRDKLTLVLSPRLWDFGAWVEQLVAESTGKRGVGIVPVDGESLAPPERYGADRLFVEVGLAGDEDSAREAALDALAAAGQPVVRLRLDDPHDLAGEFFRWQVATAVAGSLLGIHPFDQPDVEASKVETRKLTEEVERTGSLPAEESSFSPGGVRLFTDAGSAEEIGRAAGGDRTLAGLLGAHLARLQVGDYFALLAFVEMSPSHRERLQAIRHAVRDSRRVATCLGFGPRFLHSTGQAYKGGPDIGVFLQVTCDDGRDLPVPGRRITFGQVKAAQARGDFAVLGERGRRALRVHLTADVEAGLDDLLAAVRARPRGG